MTQRDLIEVVFEPGCEVVIDVLRKVFGQEAGHDAANVRRDKSFRVHLDVFAILERCDNARIGRRPADAVFLERLDEAGFGKARGRLGEVLFGSQLFELDRVAFLDFR